MPRGDHREHDRLHVAVRVRAGDFEGLGQRHEGFALQQMGSMGQILVLAGGGGDVNPNDCGGRELQPERGRMASPFQGQLRQSSRLARCQTDA